MKKIFTIISATALFFATTSCGEKTETPTVQAPAGMLNLDLSKYGKQFSLFIPDTANAKLEIVEQSWGALEIKVGKNFQISITEDPGDIELKRSDVKSNDINLFKSFLVEEPLSLMWESEITKPEFHFYMIKKAGANSYVFEDIVPADGEPIGKDNIQKMYDSAKTIVSKVKTDA